MTNRQNEPIFRMAKVLKRHKDEKGSYTRLAEAIREANGTKEPPVDRRKLKNITDGKPTNLSWREIIALDTYLSHFGEGLAEQPLLERPSVLAGLAELGKVTLLMGAYPRGKEARGRNDLSRWDLRSLNKLQGEIGKLRPGTQTNIDDVLLASAEKLSSARKQINRYLKDENTSVCCIGSPRSCPAAELMLASMFQVKPFQRPSSKLPFYFVWSPDTLKFYPSAFTLDAEDIEIMNPALAKEISTEETWAMVADGIPHEVRRAGLKEWKVYGIVAAQRQSSGQVWSVVAGLSGPATLASAMAVASQQTGALPERHGAPSAVLWALIEATVRQKPGTYGDNRQVLGARVLRTRMFYPDSLKSFSKPYAEPSVCSVDAVNPSE